MRSVGVLLTGVGLIAACRTEPEIHRPNILVFTLDTTRADLFGCYGNPSGATPNVDALAASGAVFTRAYTVTPLTIPAHSSVHTGLYPPRHGVRDNGDFFLEDGAVTLAERLKAAGYQTMASVGAEVTSHHWGFAQGFDAYFDDLGTSRVGGNRWAVERPGNEVVDDALEWLGAEGRGPSPWFAWVHLFDPHHPYAPPPEFAAKFPERPYLAEIAYADAQVGRVIDALKASGELDDTLVIVVADHGEGMGDHGESRHGMLLYNATTRIPMVVRPPGGLAAGRVDPSPASLVDIVPTALTHAGLAVPDDLDGVDLSPVVAAEAGRLPEFRTVYAESLYAWHVFGWAPQHALIDAEYKLIDSTTPELYYAPDATENADVAGQKPERVKAMRESLERKLTAWHPDEAAVGRAEVSAERLSQLAALGYVATPGDAGVPAEGLPDPVRQMPILKKVDEGRAAFEEGRVDEAEALLRGVLAEDPGLLPPRYLLVDVLRAQGRPGDALALAQETVALRDSSLTRSLLGMVLLMNGRPDEARVEFETSLEMDPYVASTWAPYLHLLYQRGDREGVMAALAKAKALLPDAPFVLAMEGALLVDAGNHAAAEPLFEKALAEDPKVALAHYFLGVIAASRGETPTAEKEYLAELDAHPEAVPPRLKLVELYGKERRYEDQLVQIAALRKSEGPNPGNSYAMGQALFNLGRYDEASEEVTACRVMWPAYAHCAMLEANVLAKQGDRARAEEVYQEALRLAGQAPPDSTRAP